ncbi:MAG TPA: SGNH/GDSL hydrolase family protein [Marmoricola sp.]|nr:SGNH/GDSL hydrolase family protein [Marmoricola sp.]
MTTTLRRAAGPAIGVVLLGLLAGCGGGFSSAPPKPADDSIKTYVALGDGFTAAPYAGKTVGDDGCLRSDANYPALLAKELKIGKVKDVSCTGATTAAVTSEDKPPDTKDAVKPQIDAVTSDDDLITLGLGIEDRDLLHDMFDICTAVPCGDKASPQTILSDVSSMSDTLTSAVRAIQDRAPNAYIVLVGYPTITPESGDCDALPKLDQVGLDSANLVLESINHAIRDAARATGAAFLDVAAISAGHELCSGTPWVEGKKTEKGQAVAYHPKAPEQRAVADGLAALVKTR